MFWFFEGVMEGEEKERKGAFEEWFSLLLLLLLEISMSTSSQQNDCRK